MLFRVRRFARPFSLLLLLAFAAPAAVVECAGAPASAAGRMDCCHKATTAPAMDPNCCAMEQQVPAPEQPATPATSRSFDRSASAALLPAAGPAVPGPLAALVPEPVNTGPERFDRLYLRLSSIRR